MQTRVMTRPWLAALAALWLTGIVLAVLDIRQIDRQRREETQPTWGSVDEDDGTQQGVEAVAGPSASPTPPVLVMPEATIVASRSGAAEMQGRAAKTGPRTDDLIIGPGIVTHPVAIPHDPTTPPAR